MEEKALIVKKDAMMGMLGAKKSELREKIYQKAAAFEKGVEAAINFMEEEADEAISQMALDVRDTLNGMEFAPVKTIGVAEWERDENGRLICSHCGGEAWARKYNDSGEGKQMPSQHCPWCGYEMRAYQF